MPSTMPSTPVALPFVAGFVVVRGSVRCPLHYTGSCFNCTCALVLTACCSTTARTTTPILLIPAHSKPCQQPFTLFPAITSQHSFSSTLFPMLGLITVFPPWDHASTPNPGLLTNYIYHYLYANHLLCHVLPSPMQDDNIPYYHWAVVHAWPLPPPCATLPAAAHAPIHAFPLLHLTRLFPFPCLHTFLPTVALWFFFCTLPCMYFGSGLVLPSFGFLVTYSCS